MYDLIVVGGGAAGFFAAINAKHSFPEARVALIEKTAVLLSKVRISGGGRCNVTHSCFDNYELTNHYPRGKKELLSPFLRFGCRETMEWFASRGVALKTEEDGRIFPTTDNSETIISCLSGEAQKLGVEIFLRQKIETITHENHFTLQLKEGKSLTSSRLLLATGSSTEGYNWARAFGHSISPPVPSLFTFNIENFALKELSGVSFEQVNVSLKGTSFSHSGPLLITHFGFSGPAVLKLSAWAARYLHEQGYETEVLIQWLPFSSQVIFEQLLTCKRASPNKTLLAENPFRLPRSFWKLFLGEIHFTRLRDIPEKTLRQLAERLYADSYQMKGKTTHKEEFVTCGGVALKEIDFKRMESKIVPGLFFAGEILDIDGVTGGFNFQNAWTTGFIAGNSVLNP